MVGLSEEEEEEEGEKQLRFLVRLMELLMKKASPERVKLSAGKKGAETEARMKLRKNKKKKKETQRSESEELLIAVAQNGKS